MNSAEDSNSTKKLGAKLTKPAHRHALPGDKIATIEEFEAGPGSLAIGEAIIASRVGDVDPDMSNRIISVRLAKAALGKLPSVGDLVTGTVQSVATSVAQVKID